MLTFLGKCQPWIQTCISMLGRAVGEEAGRKGGWGNWGTTQQSSPRPSSPPDAERGLPEALPTQMEELMETTKEKL